MKFLPFQLIFNIVSVFNLRTSLKTTARDGSLLFKNYLLLLLLFVVADRKEVHFDCEIRSLEGRLDKITDEAAEQLLKVTSPENRYESYLHQRHRVAEQRQEEGEVSLYNVLLIVKALLEHATLKVLERLQVPGRINLYKSNQKVTAFCCYEILWRSMLPSKG